MGHAGHDVVPDEASSVLKGQEHLFHLDAYDEMDKVRNLNLEAIDKIKHFTNVIYSKTDNWAPIPYMEDLYKYQPELTMKEVDIDHAFVLKSSERTAEMGYKIRTNNTHTPKRDNTHRTQNDSSQTPGVTRRRRQDPRVALSSSITSAGRLQKRISELFNSISVDGRRRVGFLTQGSSAPRPAARLRLPDAFKSTSLILRHGFPRTETASLPDRSRLRKRVSVLSSSASDDASGDERSLRTMRGSNTAGAVAGAAGTMAGDCGACDGEGAGEARGRSEWDRARGV
ncbi:hypothetical protein HW555_002586 [Spodoptera exigua]|uniref:Uncharacterized protein n=1 Tax=Spodoptera exigua TaxID=7107 RepID=A0A835L971_SPOEX|nr:hypothetical protein HW555_002586 [Spodoptera exigua]